MLLFGFGISIGGWFALLLEIPQLRSVWRHPLLAWTSPPFEQPARQHQLSIQRLKDFGAPGWLSHPKLLLRGFPLPSSGNPTGSGRRRKLALQPRSWMGARIERFLALSPCRLPDQIRLGSSLTPWPLTADSDWRSVSSGTSIDYTPKQLARTGQHRL